MMTKAERIAQIILDINEARIAAEKQYADKKKQLATVDATYSALLDKKKAAELFAIDSIKLSGEYSTSLKALNAEIVEKLTEYESKHGININYSCIKCNDTGYVNHDLCDCILKKLNTAQPQNHTAYNLPGYSLHDENIINALFVGTRQESEMRNIYDNFKKYAKQFPTIKLKNILLIGGSGCGKSGAVLALYNEMTMLEHSTLYLTAFSMHNAFLHYHTAPIESKSEHLDTLLNVDFLVIDDLGTEPIFKNVTLEYLYLLLETRISTGKGTAITTNLTIDALIERYGERLVSRMTSKAYTLVRYIPNCSDLRGRK